MNDLRCTFCGREGHRASSCPRRKHINTALALTRAQEASYAAGACRCIRDGGICDSCVPVGAALYKELHRA